ncbi:MAG: hypothetical protein KY468_16135 [Armatimonadetes bacterium]|nr:hypothetical protein [Armatimonadota bacterium]
MSGVNVWATLVPFHYAPVVESVKKTGKLLLASDAVERGSILQTFAHKIGTLAFEYLDAPPVGGRGTGSPRPTRGRTASSRSIEAG